MPEESLPEDVDELMKAFGVDPAKGGGAPGKPPSPPQGGPSPEGKGHPQKPNLENFKGGEVAEAPKANVDLLNDVALNVRIEIGRTRMYVQDVLKLASGSVVDLDRLTGDPLDIYVNDCLVARGEVLVINENFAVRVTEVIDSTRAREKGG